MKRRLLILFLCTALLLPYTAHGAVLDYDGTLNTYKQDSRIPQSFLISDGAGEAVWVVAKSDIAYVTTRDALIRSMPGEKGAAHRKVLLGTKLQRVGVCSNGWSKVTFQKQGENKIIGYVPTNILSSKTKMKKFTDTVTAAKDCDILDFPGRKDGQVVGEIIQEDKITRTATVNSVWSRILFKDAGGADQVGYIPTNVLKGQKKAKKKAAGAAPQIDEDGIDETVEAGTIHKSSGDGIFAQAVDEVTSTNGEGNGNTAAQIGQPISVSADATVRPLGNFKITHYCQCSICCGPWANGITSTGVTATTNRTIAVDPTQIPYGSKVVINGQIYVAEDCGGAIKKNCIDIYVASHEEGEAKGVFYTEVYLLEE